MMYLTLMIFVLDVKYVYLVYCMRPDYFDGLRNRFAPVLIFFS
jgi:hypothetical protein